jgi:hypothetical protein
MQHRMAPDFLTVDDVLWLHEDQIDSYGRAGGLRSLPLLESAVAQPLQEDVMALAPPRPSPPDCGGAAKVLRWRLVRLRGEWL